jgi:hypothetical protein
MRSRPTAGERPGLILKIRSYEMVKRPWLKLKRALRRHGLIGVLGVGAERLVRRLNRLRPSVRAAIRESARRTALFDAQFGVDTGGFIHPTELTIGSPNQVHAVAYGGSDPKAFRDALKTLPLGSRRFVFIDFGSGKGRALLLASEFSFKRIVGVEFAEELHEIALENLRRFKKYVPEGTAIESVCMDAVDYPLPDDHLVCYFCNPFNETIMSRILTNIRDSFLKVPREIFLVYYNPKLKYLLDQDVFFKRIGEVDNIFVWKAVGPDLS